MEGVLIFGFLVGMGHALEADHLAAVATMATGHNSRKRLAFMGAAWGLGHTITLFTLCSAVILLGFVLTDRLAATLEFSVGVMLVTLGANVFWKMRRAKVHFHVHDHGDGHRHFHAHSHRHANVPHHADPHDHEHPSGFPVKAFLVGLVHGAAGSAALLALALAAAKNPLAAVLYVIVFGIGSVLGMAVLSFAAAWPLGLAERSVSWFYRGLHIVIASIAITIGVYVVLETMPIIWGAA